MEAMVRKGKARAIGVSNFSKPNLEKVLSVATIVPAVNQVRAPSLSPRRGANSVLCRRRSIYSTRNINWWSL